MHCLASLCVPGRQIGPSAAHILCTQPGRAVVLENASTKIQHLKLKRQTASECPISNFYLNNFAPY